MIEIFVIVSPIDRKYITDPTDPTRITPLVFNTYDAAKAHLLTLADNWYEINKIFVVDKRL